MKIVLASNNRGKLFELQALLAGLGVVVYYMLVNTDTLRSALGLVAGGGLWWSIQPNSAGVFGVPVGLLVTWLVSLWSAKNTV